MKKIMLVMFAAWLGSNPANAQIKDTLVVSAGTSKNITLADNMNVVLVQAGAQDHAFSIEEKAARKLSISLSGNSLRIEPQGNLSKQTTVYVLIQKLEKLSVGFDTQVRTIGVLQTKGLDLFIDSLATAHLRTTGEVKAYPLGDFDVNIAKQPTNLVVQNAR